MCVGFPGMMTPMEMALIMPWWPHLWEMRLKGECYSPPRLQVLWYISLLPARRSQGKRR